MRSEREQELWDQHMRNQCGGGRPLEPGPCSSEPGWILTSVKVACYCVTAWFLLNVIIAIVRAAVIPGLSFGLTVLFTKQGGMWSTILTSAGFVWAAVRFLRRDDMDSARACGLCLSQLLGIYGAYLWIVSSEAGRSQWEAVSVVGKVLSLLITGLIGGSAVVFPVVLLLGLILAAFLGKVRLPRRVDVVAACAAPQMFCPKPSDVGVPRSFADRDTSSDIDVSGWSASVWVMFSLGLLLLAIPATAIGWSVAEFAYSFERAQLKEELTKPQLFALGSGVSYLFSLFLFVPWFRSKVF